MKVIQIDELKKIALDILIDVVKICDENELQYFLGGGTLLGAIRHKGFIPWDDDIDIMMPRQDYEKLLHIYNQQTEKNEYRLISYKNNKKYFYSFAKVINTNTVLIENEYNQTVDMGIYIDIFPIDKLPDEEYKIAKIFNKYKRLDKVLQCYVLKNLKELTSSTMKLFIKKIVKFVISTFKLSNFIVYLMDRECTRYTGRDTNTVACITGVYGEKEIMPKNYISSYQLQEFEGQLLKIPTGYHEYLTKHYGDYMKLPPKEKQISNHNTKVYWKEE